MSWSEFHKQSEEYAAAAQMSLTAGEPEEAVRLYNSAAEAEQKALGDVDITKARTRGITAVSAVALWFKGRAYAEAEHLAYSMLADPHLPQFARDDLRTLVQAIWTESVKKEAGVAFIPGQVLVSVKGGEVVTGGAPLDLIVDKVQAIQSIFYRTIEFIKGATLRRRGSPAKELQDACRPWLFQSAPGSYQFSVAIQKPAQPDFFREDVEPEQVVARFLQIVSASSEADTAALEKLVPNEGYRDTFLKLTRNLAPTGKNFERIEFRASGELRPVTVGFEARTLINQELRKPVPNIAEEGPPEELQGILRGVHLDKDWLEVVVDSASVHVEGLQDAVDDVIGPMVNRQVRVRVNRTAQQKLKFLDVELVE
jgi:hypothetical protein